MPTPPALPYLVAVLLIGRCVAADPPHPQGSGEWTYGEGVWNTGDQQVLRGDVAGAMPDGVGVVTVRMPAHEPVATAVPVLLASLDHGATAWRLGADGDDTVLVGLPPNRGASLFVPVLLHPTGVRVSTPGGAEHELPCQPCLTADDWPVDRIVPTLDADGVGAVALLFREDVPWGVVVDAATAIAASGREVRLARG